MFQRVNEWLMERGERFARSAEANARSGGAYYANSETEQAYGGETAQGDRNNPEADDPYGGRVPYRSQKDMQAEAEMQRQQAEEQARRQAVAQQRQQQQQQAYNNYAQPQGPYAQPQAAYAQPPQNPSYAQQQSSNVLPFPGMIRGPEGNLYAHVEYIVLLRNRNECTKVIEYIKSNASVFLNMEFIANDSERQRCVDMLSGAAYTLGCRLSKISQRGIYLISSPSVYVVLDPAMQKYTAAPESHGYARPEYGRQQGYGSAAPYYGYPDARQAGAGYASGAQAPGYGAWQNPGYAAAQRNPGYASAQQGPGYGAEQNDNAARQYGRQAYASYEGRNEGYAAQSQQQPAYASGRQNEAYAAQQQPAYASGRQNEGYAAQARGEDYARQAQAYEARSEESYNARRDREFSADASTGVYRMQRAETQPTEPAADAYAQSAAYVAQPRRTAAYGVNNAYRASAESAAGE
jgi:FtsZ-interacting cell division protein YlmF